MKASVGDATAGMVGVVEKVGYAEREAATSVLLDIADGVSAGVGAFYYDNELEAE
ncbi:hypothetical protein ABZ916_25610 [Streptomyces sp. NPDC046853]|uniref:hypothetical protein n=1 Tax=Streptomyces sp. NPDC046853 TaxID=3154920 RepID=UPI0033CFC5B5